jgi:2-methylisocitrate lyase-like PEP mutase family enzyme
VDAENFLIIARTDARQSEGLEGVLKRLEAYSRAGADILFPEALSSEEEMRIACARFDRPVMANMADGGLTPVLPADVLRDVGYAFAIYPSATSLAAAAAMETLLTSLKTTGQYVGEPLFDFKEFCSLVGFEEVWAFERKWARR